MARTGRRRQIDDVESADDIPRSNEIKRPKIEAGMEDVSSSELESNSSNDDEKEADDDSEDMDGEEQQFDDEELLAAYTRSKKDQKGYVGSTSKAGVIKSISLRDFMCHRHLTVNFGPRMNFVVGHNGSGKSAVLTGIAVALGSKATVTGRGSGLKDLIRQGCDRAIITIVLANSGEEAYRSNIYSPNIVIERTINSNGSTGYKFKASKEGKTLANKRSELSSICDHFNINIDSPLTILTQDQSRSFLQNADPYKLYKFFLNGTQLSCLLDTYESAGQNIASLDNHIKRQKEALPDLKNKVEGLKRKIQASRKVMKQRRKNKQLLIELAWSYVKEKEQAKEEAENEVSTYQEKLSLVHVEINKAEREMPQVIKRILQTEQDVENQDNSLRPLLRTVKDAQVRYTEARKELKTMELAIPDIETELAEEKASLVKLEKKIEERLRLNEPDQIEARERLIQRRTKSEEILGKIRLERPARERERQEKFEDQKKSKRELESIEDEIKQLDHQAMQINNQIHNISRQENNRMAAFGINIEPLLDEIKTTRWHEKPLGPLGYYVHLDDMHYADILQRMLGSALCAFAVKHNEDKVKLMGIIDKHFKRGYRPGNYTAKEGAHPPAIFRHAGELFDYSGGDLSNLGPTILSKLRFDNEEVLRLLIDNCNIERTFLAPNIVEGNRMMDHTLGKGLNHVTINCADGMTTAGTVSTRQSGPTNRYRGVPLFTADIGTEIQKLQNQLQEIEKKRTELMQSTSPVRQHIAKLQGEMTSLTKLIESLIKKMSPLEKDLDLTKRKLAEMATTEMDSSESIREELQQKIGELELKIQQHQGDIEKQKQIILNRDAEIKQRQDEVDAHAPRKQQLIEMMNSLIQERSKIENSQRHYQNSLASYERRLEAAKEHLAGVAKNLEIFTQKAKNFAPQRIETNRKPEELEAERKSLDKSITEASKTLGFNLDELTADYRKQKEIWQNASNSIRDLKSLYNMLQRAMINRRTWWGQTRSHISIRARTAFVVFESFRGLDGRLEFDHQQGRLSLLVHNQVSTESQNGTFTQTSHYKGTKALSGGERSFSTVSLLLALWSTVPCPLRALDEWDVFLDAANRRVAAKNLMEGAKESDGKQYILITPLDMQGIDISGPDKKIIRMADPERGQGTIELQSQSM
ncbi:hypothetical protein L204_105863 [Cryptococcus depauperatus]